MHRNFVSHISVTKGVKEMMIDFFYYNTATENVMLIMNRPKPPIIKDHAQYFIIFIMQHDFPIPQNIFKFLESTLSYYFFFNTIYLMAMQK